MNEDAIRMRIRNMVATGVLPCDSPEGTWAGQGRGIRCIACAETIPPSEVEYEVDLAGATYRVHPTCYRIWQDECEPLRQA